MTRSPPRDEDEVPDDTGRRAGCRPRRTARRRVGSATGSADGASPARPGARARSTTRPPVGSTRTSTSPRSRRSAAAVAAAKAAFPAWRATSLSKRTDIMFRIRNLVEAHRKELAAHLTAEHGKVPSDALGEIARGIENLEFACGIPSLLKGGFSEQVSSGVDVYQIRQPLGRRGRHHAVQLPGDGPDVDVRHGHRLRQHVHPQAVREGPVGVDLPGRAARRGRASRTACSTSSTATRSRSTRSSSTPTSPPSRFVGSTPIARYIYETGTQARQARPGARRREEPHDRAARRRHRHGRRRRGLGRLRLGRRALHGDRDDRGRRRRRAIRWSRRSRRACRRSRSGRAAIPTAEMGPLVTKQHRDKVASYLDSRPGPGRDARRRRPRAPALRRVGRVLPGRLAHRPRHDRRWTPTATRSSGRC